MSHWQFLRVFITHSVLPSSTSASRPTVTVTVVSRRRRSGSGWAWGHCEPAAGFQRQTRRSSARLKSASLGPRAALTLNPGGFRTPGPAGARIMMIGRRAQLIRVGSASVRVKLEIQIHFHSRIKRRPRRQSLCTCQSLRRSVRLVLSVESEGRARTHNTPAGANTTYPPRRASRVLSQLRT